MAEPERKKYVSGVSTDLKLYAATIYSELKGKKVNRALFVAASKKGGYDVSARTLSRHASEIRSGRSPFSEEKKSGRPRVLTSEEWDIICGAIFMANEEVNLVWVAVLIDELFDKEPSFSTISRRLQEKGLVYKATGRRGWRKGYCFNDYVVEYYEGLLKLRNLTFFQWDPKKVLCVDFCTNSVRLDRIFAYQLKGEKQKKIALEKPAYTNSYFACMTLDGTKMYRPVMFTHDPAFAPKRRNGLLSEEIQSWIEAWQLESWQIVYTKSSKKYCKESNDQVSHYLSLYRRQLANTRIIHDAGNSFKIRQKNETSLILADGADRVEVLPTEPHGEMSVLDNNIFAIAKNWWRVERTNMSSPKHALYLLYCIDSVDRDAIASCWRRNFFLDDQDLSLTKVEDLLRRTKGSRAKQDERRAMQRQYLQAYAQFQQERAQETQMNDSE